MASLLRSIKQRALADWNWTTLQFEAIRQSPGAQQQAPFLGAGIVIVSLLLLFSGATAAVAAVAAWIALLRHFAQTEADRQRRISESYGRAVGQLASEKVEERLGGIYTLERISIESAKEYYWVVMETLAAFLRERARWEDPDPSVSSESSNATNSTDHNRERRVRRGQATDIAAVLAVIRRRPSYERNREKQQNRFFSLRDTDLRGAYLRDLHLEYADLGGTHLDGADLRGAQLTGSYLEAANLSAAQLRTACLHGANLANARLEGAGLQGANLAGAHLRMAHLEGASLRAADLEGADVEGTHLESAYLLEAKLKGVDLNKAIGDSKTRLPDLVSRPTHWPPFRPDDPAQ